MSHQVSAPVALAPDNRLLADGRGCDPAAHDFRCHSRCRCRRLCADVAAAGRPPEVERPPPLTAVAAAGLVAGFGVAIPVGPVAVYLVTLTARTSVRVGTAAALGIATVDAGYALVAVVAGSAVVRVLRPVVPALHWTAAAVLLALGVRMALGALTDRASSPSATEAEQLSAPRAYLQLTALTLVNPSTVVYFAALVVGLRSLSGEAPAFVTGTVFVVAVFLASASWQLLLAGGGALLGRRLVNRTGQRYTSLICGLVILALAARVALS
jgi:threonine/homoserine/homoserine lactone efflux protein